jgi:hypothetical protein
MKGWLLIETLLVLLLANAIVRFATPRGGLNCEGDLAHRRRVVEGAAREPGVLQPVAGGRANDVVL